MKLKPFMLERYFARYEFSAKYLLSSSDCDGLSQKKLLSMADPEMKSAWESLTLGYTESLGHPLLRAEAARLYSGINPEDILITAPEEGIFLALNAMLNQGDHIICTFPGYQSLYEIAEGLGCDVTKWQPQEDNGWRFDPDVLETLIQPNTKLLVINFPHNPTGYLPTKSDFLNIIAWAKNHSLSVFSDEMYRFLEHDSADRLPSACEIYDQAVSLFGMSKTFGMAGVRIGWVVTKNKELFSAMATFKDYTTICSSAPGELLSVIALRAKDVIITAHINRIRKNLRLIDAFMKKYSTQFSWVRPKAGTIGFPKLRGSENSFDFCQRVVHDANIMLLPSSVYDYDNFHFRLGFGRENMPEALTALESYLSKNSVSL
jgi:aspartate/methionine/tyrosine aminotransferase